MDERDDTGLVFRIEKYMVDDGQGIRTNIFLKGCPLRCKWCFNPEGITGKPEILIFKNKCTLCEECTDACPKNIIQIKQGQPKIDRESCDVCEKCVSVCPSGALEICGKLMTVNEILDEVRKDEVFYRRSGGGVTLTGGELSAQPKFAKNLLIACKGEFHTVIETSGYASWSNLKEFLEYSDQVFFDLKHMDPKEHHKLTGVKNDLILINLKKASEIHRHIIVRIPIIPGFNDGRDNIIQTAKFVKSIENISKIEMLPYVNFGKSKYEMLDLTYEIPDVESPSSDRLRNLKNLINQYGVDCDIIQ